MDNGFSEAVVSGNLLVAVPIAVLVGLIGFLSPCVLPLVPGYLSFLATVSGTDPKRARARCCGAAALFVLGFTAVFIAHGFLFASVGVMLAVHHRLLQQVCGIVTIAMGFTYLGAFSFLQRDVRLRRPRARGLISAPLLGFTFALGWSPCTGPTLAAVLGLSGSTGAASRGVFLAAAYCAGLGIPFLLLAAGTGWAAKSVNFIRAHRGTVTRLGGALLVVIGLLLFSGRWDAAAGALQTFASAHLPFVGATL
ncbi:cytochrome c biogenesis CcdA family protein [Jatrophihabitans sp. DSM 45814]